MEDKLAILFEPYQIKNMTVKNRVVMAPMHTKLASESGEVTDRMLAYLIERARGGVGLIVLENTCIDWVFGRAAGNPVTIHDDLNRTGLSKIAMAVHRFGVKIVTQLHHTGRQNLRSNIGGGQAPVAPSVVKSKIGGDEPRALEESEIEGIIQQYVDAARRTKDAGFDGVELHGAHGYILTQFFSPYTNRRTDKWGGSLKNRARFPLEVVRRIRAEVGPDFPILYRLSAEERIPGGTTLEDSLKLVKMLEASGVDCFDVTAGIYDSVEWIYTLQGVAPGALIPLAQAVKGVTDKPVIGVSRLGWDLGYAAQVVKEGKVDLVAIGRSLLADPYLVKKTYQGCTKEIRRCIACNECVAMENKGWQVHCIINPLLSNEYLDSVKPARTSKKAVIVGGGPAGMECALVAAQRGHDVTLFEESSRLGGQLVAASRPAYKNQEFKALIEYYEYMLKKEGVRIVLDTGVKESLPEGCEADVVILALGAFSDSGKFKDNTNLITAFDVLMSKGKNVGEKVVIIGASGVGIDVALYLMEAGNRKITVVEMQDEIGGDVNEFLKRHTLGMAEEKGIEFLTNCEVTGVERGRVIMKTLMGEREIACDTVVSAIGFVSRETDTLTKSLEEIGVEVYVIGSAVEPGKIFDATQSGFWTAVEI